MKTGVWAPKTHLKAGLGPQSPFKSWEGNGGPAVIPVAEGRHRKSTEQTDSDYRD